jgi:hypothetical protein
MQVLFNSTVSTVVVELGEMWKEEDSLPVGAADYENFG